jgi:hypothetical protein
LAEKTLAVEFKNPWNLLAEFNSDLLCAKRCPVSTCNAISVATYEVLFSINQIALDA